ncbi:MAG: M12 family metallopeptidase [Polyangiales bacterium]
MGRASGWTQGIAVALVGGALGACGGQVVTSAAEETPSAPHEAQGPRGVSRVGTFAIQGARLRLRYEQVGGQRVHDGDILLPAPEEERGAVDPATLSVGQTTTSSQWANNTVLYAFAPDLPSDRRTRVLAAMAHWSANTPMRFLEVAYLTPASLDHVLIQPSASCNSNVGRIGGEQVLNVAGWCTEGNLIHELGHTVGLWHEHTRSDRDAHVVYDEGCVTGVVPEPGATIEEILAGPPTSNFNVRPPGGEYGLYDASSVMHYGSTSFSDQTPTALCDNPFGYTLWRRSSAPGTWDVVSAQRVGLSFIDRQGVAEMYAEGFGHAVAAGDFNGDGYVDAAVGAPRRGDARDGRVRIFLGGAGGLTRSIELAQVTGGEAEDRFGFSLATGDFNGDGLKDLAVGVPGEDARQGRVMIYLGARNALAPLSLQTTLAASPLGLNFDGDRFGYSLAAGDLDGDGDDDLAVGLPGSGTSSAPAAGSVRLFRGGPAPLSLWTTLVQTGADFEAGDNFGAAVAVADIDQDGFADVAVGVPHERFALNPEAGVVALYRGGATPAFWRTLLPQQGSTNYAAWDLFFGFSLSTGDYNADGYPDVAVGAPGATIDGLRWAGRVFVYHGAASGPAILASTLLGQQTPSQGAAFGFSLASGRFDQERGGDLAVGAPGGDPTPGVSSGQVVVFSGRSTSPSLVRAVTLNQAGAGHDDEAGDRFGADVELADFDNDGDADLLAGANGEVWADLNQGRGYLYRASAGALTGWTTVGP